MAGLIEIRAHASLDEAGAALAARVAADLQAALGRAPRATLVVPGGSTPGPFLRALASRSLDWPRVDLTLSDERWVPPRHPRANAAAVLAELGATGAQWHPLWRDTPDPAAAAAEVAAALVRLHWPPDVAVLGMGEDGHVASLFPGADEALWQANAACAPAAGPDGEQRLSLAPRALAAAGRLYLLTAGAAKRRLLAEPGHLPVHRLLALRDGGAQAYHAEER